MFGTPGSMALFERSLWQEATRGRPIKKKRKVNDLGALVDRNGAELQLIDQDNAIPSILTGVLEIVNAYTNAHLCAGAEPTEEGCR